MKQKVILFFVLMLQLGLTTAFAKIQEVDPKEKKEIKLLEDKKHLPYSISLVELQAYQDGVTIELFVENYTGPVTMRIAGGSQSVTVVVNESGYATMDISQLPEGNYTLQVTVGGTVFEGFFKL